MVRRIVHWLLDRLILKGEMKMSDFSRENKLRILGIMGDEVAEIAYRLDGGYSETLSAEKLLITPAKFHLIEKAATATETERKDLIHEVIRLSFAIMSNMPSQLFFRSEILSGIYNVISDRYGLPIPSAIVPESIYADEKFRSFLREVNDFITKVNPPVENNDDNCNDDAELIPEPEKLSADYVLRQLVPYGACDRTISITAKGLSREQCEKLVMLALSYIAENNSESSDNHSSLTIE